jgi:hypothetical protein
VQRWFQKNLNDDQKARRSEASAEMLEPLETKPDFLNRVITGDERWWHTPLSRSQKKTRMSKSKIKTMDIIFLYSFVVVHIGSVPPNVTVNQNYLEARDRLRMKVMRIRMKIAEDWIL